MAAKILYNLPEMGRCLSSYSDPVWFPPLLSVGGSWGEHMPGYSFPRSPSLDEDSPKRTAISPLDSCHLPSPLSSSPSGASSVLDYCGGPSPPPAAAPWSHRHRDYPHAVPSSLFPVGNCGSSKPSSSFWKDLFQEV